MTPSPERTAEPSPPPWRITGERPVVLRDGRAVRLRPLRASDAERMADFFDALTEREIYYFFRLDAKGAAELALQAAHARAYRLIALDEQDGRVLGYTFVQWRADGLPSFGLCIHRATQSLGLGRLMSDLLFATAAASGVGRVTLTVHPDNGPALRLYQRAGFRLVGEFINRHQGVKQYRMEADLQQERPAVLEGVAIIPLGGVGVGLAAAEVQRAIAEQRGRLPLLLDRPPPAALAIFVADLSVAPILPTIAAEAASGGGPTGPQWITRLDRRHLLIGGVGSAALAAACHRYVHLLQTRGSANLPHSFPVLSLNSRAAHTPSAVRRGGAGAARTPSRRRGRSPPSSFRRWVV